MNQGTSFIAESINSPCPGCGNQMIYSVEKSALNCSYCDYTEGLKECNTKVKETALKEFLLQTITYSPVEVNETIFQCDNCGNEFIGSDDLVNVNCGFCGSHFINELAFNKKLIKPNAILPFQVSQEEADDMFFTWAKKGWLAPNKLHKAVHDQQLHGIYIPFWSYNADSDSYYSGHRGRTKYKTSRVNGKNVTKKEIIWTAVDGDLEFSFKDILVVATDHIEQSLVEKILPFETQKLQSFNSQYLKGWATDVYDLEVDEAYDIADNIMDSKLEDMVRFKIGGSEQRIDLIDTIKYNQSFKLILLPIFICSYMYQNKLYQFAINGHSGKIVGKRPRSIVKLTCLILIGVILVIIYMMYFK